MMSAAVVRLTKLCAPKCLNFSQIQVSSQESQCLDMCVKRLQQSHERTIDYFRDFESTQKREQEQAQVEKEKQEIIEIKKAEDNKIVERKKRDGLISM